MIRASIAAFLIALFLSACTPTPEADPLFVSLFVDGRELTFQYDAPVTVGEFLQQAEIEVGELDRVSPPEFTQIVDGMRVTIVRVEEQIDCQETDIPYSQQIVYNEGLEAGEQLLGQAGENGVEEVCYRVFIEDGIRRDPVEISRVVLKEPQPELIFEGPTGQLDPVPITGTLAYIGNNNAWIMQGSSTTKRPLTTDGDLDQRVFSLSADGRRLIFTRSVRNPARSNFLNQLWLIGDTTTDTPAVQLVPEDVLYAAWIPGRDNTISYSTGEGRQAAPGWQAFNDLWTMRIDPRTGEALSINSILDPSSGGLYGWWGTVFEWSPQGDALAWVRADSMGLVDLETAELIPLLQYPLFNTRADWSWRAGVSWSDNADLLLTTVHGEPIGSEPPEFSPVFHVAVTNQAGDFQANIVDNAGIWSSPRYSPLISNPDSEYPDGYIAYLQARDISNSINNQAEYDLYVADRDGSNPRRIFPENGRPGLNAPQQLAWSPDGQQIAFIYQGNLWIIDVETSVANQLTLDGGASRPVWTP